MDSDEKNLRSWARDVLGMRHFSVLVKRIILDARPTKEELHSIIHPLGDSRLFGLAPDLSDHKKYYYNKDLRTARLSQEMSQITNNIYCLLEKYSTQKDV